MGRVGRLACKNDRVRLPDGKNGAEDGIACSVHDSILTANGTNDNKQYGVFTCDIGTYLQKSMVKSKKILQNPLEAAIMRGDRKACGLLVSKRRNGL